MKNKKQNSWKTIVDFTKIQKGGVPIDEILLRLDEKRFQKREEDFVCEHCGAEVKGNGYTNHCPKCLWGKHVDVNPGDRAAKCGGMMEPIGVEVKGDEYTLLHKCTQCGFERKNKSVPEDDFDALVALSR